MCLEGFSSVIPAKAGIHASLKPTPSHPWMPAFAGMTGVRHVRSVIEVTRSCPVNYARLYTKFAWMRSGLARMQYVGKRNPRARGAGPCGAAPAALRSLLSMLIEPL